ncbi:MAG: hypothetical protein HC886_16195 [Leptolyngbyaceae cyanobacterium SM1_1_3]|nr:hypothetical protein [Leptolyngbyaceae cyanobacterium SM1_1_3]
MRLPIDNRYWQSRNYVDFQRIIVPICFKSAIVARWIKRSTRSKQTKAIGSLSGITRQ